MQQLSLVGERNTKMRTFKFARSETCTRASIVRGEALELLKQRLQSPEGFHSYGEIQQWFVTELKLNIAYKTVYQLVRYQLKQLKFPSSKP